MNMKKKLRGLTLMEVIVALAIYAILALLTTEIMTLVNSTMRSTTHLNRRLAYESKFADTLTTAGLNSVDADVQVEYGGGAGAAAGGSLKLNDADEVTANFPDESSDDVRTNYHFLVVNENQIELSNVPEQPFVLRLRVNVGARAYTAGGPSTTTNLLELKSLEIKNNGFLLAPADPAQGFHVVSNTIDGDPCFSYEPQKNDSNGRYDITTAADMSLNLSGSGVDWRQPFCVDIPLMYKDKVDVTNPGEGNQMLEVTAKATMVGDKYATSNQTYDRDFSTMTLTYCTAMPFTNANGVLDVQYYGIDKAGYNYGSSVLGGAYVGASYELVSDGTVDVRNH